MEYIRINPMALVGTANARKVNTQRSISLDVYELILKGIASAPETTFTERQKAVRDKFIFEALRGLGLRSSELVAARMSAFYQLSVPKVGTRYWIFHVTPETGKGGKERRIPVPLPVWEAFTVYRRAFGLPEQPAAGETTGLLLSTRTNPVAMRDTLIRRTQDRRFFKAWREITTRQGVYTIVKDRLAAAGAALEALGDSFSAHQLRAASPHWLRHTFGKASLLAGQNVREVASALGHASLETTMIYTEQDALDLINAVERASPGSLASEAALILQSTTPTTNQLEAVHPFHLP